MPNMKPILFSTPMVQAILAGQKTATRRIIRQEVVDRFVLGDDGRLLGSYREGMAEAYPTIDDSPIQEGDVLWVRESFKPNMDGYTGIDFGGIIYRADSAVHMFSDPYNPWKPSIHMPRKIARLFLRINDVRVERLQDITETDALKEGIKYWDDVGCCCSNRKFMDYRTGEFSIKNDHAESFKTLWDGINASRGYGWDKNPWVWVYEFERITREEAEA